MNKKVYIQELAIVVASPNYNPTVLTVDFLKYSGIVPNDWELASQPISTNRAAQVIFANGVTLVAEPNRIIFLEPIADEKVKTALVPGIARQYIETLSKVDYQGIGISIRGHVPFDSQSRDASKYISETLLSPGAWQELGGEPVRATVNYTYTLPQCQFHLNVSEAALSQQDETITPVVLFSGNFSYDLTSLVESERLKALYKALENWQVNLETYYDIVNNKFLDKLVKPVMQLPPIL